MFLERWKEMGEILSDGEYTTHRGPIDAEEALHMMRFLLSQAKSQKGIVYVIGNGGSAGIASHFSTDLQKTLEIASVTLTDPCLLTCLGNDLGYEQVYSFPLERQLRPGDLLVAISSSGKSPNIVNASKIAQKRHLPLVTLSGFSFENPLRKLGDLNFWVDSNDYGIVETLHFFLLHTVIDALAGINRPHPLQANYAHA